MDRKDLKEVIVRVIERLNEQDDTPKTACVFGDGGRCDMTTLYAVGEEG